MSNPSTLRQSPDADLAAQLEQDGYCVLPEAIPQQVCAELRGRIIEQFEGERARGTDVDQIPDESLTYGGGSGRGLGENRRVWTLINKGDLFRELLLNQRVNDLLAGVLGDPYLLSSFQANFVSAGDHAMALHSDQGYVPRPWPPYAMTASVVWMLEDFTEENGATTMIPGTHQDPDGMDPGAVLARARAIRRGGSPVCAPTGSALVFDGRVMHGTGVNRTDQPRVGVLAYYCRPFVRQQENFTLSVSDQVANELPTELMSLLGFGVWKTLGSVEGVCAEGAIVRRPSTPIGELDRTGLARSGPA